MLSAGVAESSDDVLVSAQTPILRAVPVGLPVSDPSPAIVLRKNSEPPWAVEYWPAGDVAGQTVKPGVPPTDVFSTSVTRTFGPCAASSCFEYANTWAALKPLPNRSYSLVEMKMPFASPPMCG